MDTQLIYEYILVGAAGFGLSFLALQKAKKGMNWCKVAIQNKRIKNELEERTNLLQQFKRNLELVKDEGGLYPGMACWKKPKFGPVSSVSGNLLKFEMRNENDPAVIGIFKFGDEEVKRLICYSYNHLTNDIEGIVFEAPNV